MDPLTFYFDRCFGKRFPQALEKLQPPFGVEYHHSKSNKFKQELEDDKWLAVCGQNGWIAFSHDKKFNDITVEAAAIVQHSVGCFSLCGASSLVWWKMLYLARAYDNIVHVIKGEPPPYLYKTMTTGRLQRIELP